ncbi:molybdopterin molybdotransferase MoeA [Aliiglaciecola litoralis]|uniref:Molybdopterin molybdenumtransferase n=1 Tax=Aliiglaciecola litoralis TaxID=582857 RepID=A0ABP3X1E6_9ALTE
MQCGCDAPGLMPIEQAKQIIWQTIKPVTETQLCALNCALDRIVASDIISPINVPAFDNSAMDGYALRYQDLDKSKTFKQVGKSFAGKPFSGALGEGECVRIMTGAEIPDGANTVVMQENTQAVGSTISILGEVKLGEAIRPAGGDISQGSILLKAGKRITAIDIGLLASVGLAQLNVYRKIKVAVFSTGDELLVAGKQPQPGHIYDSNGPMLVAMLNRLDAEVLDLGIIVDDRQSIANAFKQAAEFADCVITSGGVSVGEADYTRDILTETGQVDFWKLAIKPGKPLAFGRLGKCIFFGLPGNPVSAAVTFEQIAAPALLLLAGGDVQPSLALTAKTRDGFRKKPGRTDFQRAYCHTDKNGQLWVESLGSQSSGVLSGFSTSNCYAVLENQRGRVVAGEQVSISLFDRILT